MWSLCGKRFVPTTTASTEACLDCERVSGSADWRGGMEIALRDSFRQLSVKHPLDSAYLFLIRAKLRRDLGRLDEAALDLWFLYDFLLAATGATQYERLAIGGGVIAVASGLPDAHNGIVEKVCVHLMEVMEGVEPTDPAMVFLRHIRSRSMGKLGRLSDALIELDQIVALVDSGAVDRKNIGMDLWQIFSEKEHMERRLGRTDDSNATLRRFINEVETREDGGQLLIQGLIMSGVHLSADDPDQARNDLQRAIRIA